MRISITLECLGMVSSGGRWYWWRLIDLFCCETVI